MLSSGQLIGIISLAAFNFIVQLPNVLMDRAKVISFVSRLLMYLIIKFYECIVLKIFCFMKFSGLTSVSGKAWRLKSIDSALTFAFPVNLAKNELISSTSSKVVISDKDNETELWLFFLKLIWFYSKNFVSFSASQLLTVKVSKKLNLPFSLRTWNP